MHIRLVNLLAVGVLVVVPCTAIGSDRHNSPPSRRELDFIGFFQPALVGVLIDAERCPDSSHPLLLTFVGEAFTTLGHATFEQSHCEGNDHRSFRRGRQTLTFAGGDQLFARYSGVLIRTPTTESDGRLIIDGLYRNDGGTGSLKNAHGRGITAGVVDTSTGIAQVTVTGTL